jgi:para-nitrobenzyl esterase
VGELRFAPPQPPPSWPGVRNATSFGPISVQNDTPTLDWLGGAKLAQAEDCLNVNIWTPAADGAKRPVMVWIHGGGFINGSGALPMEDGTRLASRGDIVVVSLNYRLGALGCLHLGELDSTLAASGLSGIIDQVAALEWVRHNIEAFGGDPRNVTVFGSSAGAMSIATLLALPAASGLFHKAILQSGAAANVLDAAAGATRTGRFLQLVGCSSVAALRAAPYGTLLAGQARLREQIAAERPADQGGSGGMTPLSPVVDGCYLTDQPINLLEQGKVARVPLLTGTSDHEWSVFGMAGSGPRSDGELADLFLATLDDAPSAVRTYRTRIGAEATARQIHDAMMTDQVFRAPMQRLANASVRAGNPTFVYRFGWKTPALGGVLGACHALDVPFVFDNRGGPIAAFVGNDSPSSLAHDIQQAWISFARTGNPNHDGIPAWEPQRLTRRPVLRFDEVPTVLDDPERDELDLWMNLP